MEEKISMIKVTLDEARKWYYDGNESLREISLRCFTRNELEVPSISEIKTFSGAIQALGLDKDEIQQTVRVIEKTSKASAAMFKLSIVRKALNAGQDLNITNNQDFHIVWLPFNPFISYSSTLYDDELKSGRMEIIGKIKNEGVEYKVIGNSTDWFGPSSFDDYSTDEYSNCGHILSALFCCASEEIAKHFSKYFGMLITEAKYGDLPDFQITERIY